MIESKKNTIKKRRRNRHYTQKDELLDTLSRINEHKYYSRW